MREWGVLVVSMVGNPKRNDLGIQPFYQVLVLVVCSGTMNIHCSSRSSFIVPVCVSVCVLICFISASYSVLVILKLVSLVVAKWMYWLYICISHVPQWSGSREGEGRR